MEHATALADSTNAISAYLEVADDGVGKRVVFPLHDEVVIGRELQDSLASDKFLCIPEHTVSRRHARIRRRGEAYFVEDLHSFNGTFVHGDRLNPGSWERLRDGDEFNVASIRLVFHSLLVPTHESMPTVITKALDATQYTRFATSEARHSAGDAQHTVQKLHAMAQVSIALGVATDRDTLTEKIMNFIFDLFPLAERAFIFLRKDEREAPVPVAARRRGGGADDPSQLPVSRTIVDQVVNGKKAILSVDTLSDRHFGAQESIIAQAIRSVMCVPLLLEDECLGLIQVDTSSDPYAFKEQDLEMLTGVCAEAAVALKNFQLYSSIERLLDGFVRASVQAIEERDPVTAGHSFRVAGYAEHLAMALDRADDGVLKHVAFSHDQIREIRYAALLHDFGKVGVREHVLCKAKKLHHAEMRLLDLRFKYARACLEAEAYRRLAQMHAQHAFSMDEYREQLRVIDASLQAEFEKLEQFYQAIRTANEPAVSWTESPPQLADAKNYAFAGVDGESVPLLAGDEFLALTVSKGCLTPEERRQIESHVVDSYSFLILIPWTRDLAGVPAIAHGHHEKLDGSGYPMGLRAGQISTQTRILTICDIYDALTAGDRPYKKALPQQQALDLMADECKAGHIDSALFEVFVDARVWSSQQ